MHNNYNKKNLKLVKIDKNASIAIEKDLIAFLGEISRL